MLLIAACTTPELTTSEPVVTVTFLPPVTAQHYYEGLVETFNSQHPTIKIEMLHALELAPSSSRRDLRQQFTAYAGLADVFAYTDIAPDVLAATDLVQNLHPLTEADPDFSPDAIITPLLSGYQNQTGLWALPLFVEAPVVFYDASALAAIDAPRPGADWTWEQFLTLAQQLTQKDEGIWGFADPRYTAARGLAYLNNGQLVTEGKPTFHDPRAVEAFSWYAALARDHGVMPDHEEICEGKPDCTGRARMWAGSSAQQVSQETGILPLPRPHPSGTGAFPTWTQAIYLSSQAEHPEAAWVWMTYLTQCSPPPGRLPVRYTVFESSSYREQLDEQTYSTYEAILNQATLSPHRHLWFRNAQSWLRNDGMPALLSGEITAETMLHEAQSLAEEALAGRSPVATLPPPSSPTPSGESATQLVVRVNQRDPALDELIADFHHMHPEIQVQVKVRPMDQASSTIQEMAESADVVRVWPGARSVSERCFLDLQPLIQADPDFQFEELYPITVATYEHQGRLWALPAELQAYMLFYNKNLFDLANLPYPAEDWTWDDLLVAAKQLTHGEETSQQWGFGLHFTDWATLPLLQAAQRHASQSTNRGVQEMDEMCIDAPELVDALQWSLDLVHVHQVMPEPALDFARFGEGPQRFQEGRVAMVVTTQNASGIDAYGPSQNVDLGVVPLPVSGSPATGYEVTGYAIAAETQHPQAAWLWLTYLTQQASVLKTWPARRSLAGTAIFPRLPGSVREELHRAYEVTLGEYQDAATLLWGDSAHRDVIERLYTAAVRRVWETDITPQNSLIQAQAKLETYFACVAGDSSQPRRVACESQADVPGWRAIYRTGSTQ